MPTEEEYRQTLMLALPIDEASAKIRNGPPDDPEEADAPFWAGVLPVRIGFGTPEPADDMPPGIPIPSYVTHPTRPS